MAPRPLTPKWTFSRTFAGHGLRHIRDFVLSRPSPLLPHSSSLSELGCLLLEDALRVRDLPASYLAGNLYQLPDNPSTLSRKLLSPFSVPSQSLLGPLSIQIPEDVLISSRLLSRLLISPWPSGASQVPLRVYQAYVTIW